MPPTALTRRPLGRASIFLIAALALATVFWIGIATSARALTHSSSCSASSHNCLKHTSRKHKHASKKHSAKHSTKHKGHSKSTPPSATGLTTPALCENGSTPKSAGGNTFTCSDGSEPSCESGATPTSAGSRLVCPNGSGEAGPTFNMECGQESESGECTIPARPSCEDGSAPIWSRQGYYNCRSGEPTCEAGYDPVFSSSGGMIYCEPVLREEPEE